MMEESLKTLEVSDQTGDSAYASHRPTVSESENSLNERVDLHYVVSPKRSHHDVDEVTNYESPPLKRRVSISVHPPPFVYPKSYYEGYRHKLPITDENAVCEEFLVGMTPDDSGNINFELHEFRVYRIEESKRRPLELVSLNQLNIARGSNLVYIDGVLTNGIEKRYVQRVLVDTISTGHEDTSDEREFPTIWLKPHYQPKKNDGIEIWYELGDPAPEYSRYHEPFLWLASFAKYFYDFIEMSVEGDEGASQDVTIENFRQDFSLWLKSKFRGQRSFDNWLALYGKDDFRTAVAAYKDWLWNQTHGISLSTSKTRTVTLWDEILHLKAIKAAPGYCIEDTVVTPYVYKCFEPLFTTKLKVVTPVEPKQELVGVFIPPKSKIWVDVDGNYITGQYTNPKLGDVVAVERDSVTKWRKSDESEQLWYGYVTGITLNGSQLKVIWIYKPNDTILCGPGGEYPHRNELFFSNHCNCDDSDMPLLTKDIVGIISVKFFGCPGDRDAEYFIRSKYQTDDPGFLTLEITDMEKCACQYNTELEDHYLSAKAHYHVGSTVLFIEIDKGSLEPVVIRGFNDETSQINVRRLIRRTKYEPHVQHNELLYTEEITSIYPAFISRSCRIRLFLPNEAITTPYDRNGTGDCFFIRDQYSNGRIIPLTEYPNSQEFDQGFSIQDETTRPPLRGLDLFCGGGNFGRGLEEGGAVQMKWAVDIESAPLHSYRANLNDLNDTALYLGSINNYLKDAILGNYSKTVAAKGEVDFISAGSPCQGFSNANGQKNSEKSIQNCSLVSTLATAIDIYKPRYALLENVSGLATTRQVGERQCNVFSTLLCCIVGMGYQCQQFIIDSWSHGNPQSRTRLFLAVSAPGSSLLTRPPRSHRHPDDQRGLGLYKAPNGFDFGKRELEGLCPFNVRTAGDGFRNLPNIHDDHVGICIPFPDHRCSREEGISTRTLLAHIPRFPDRQGWYQTVIRDRLHPDLRPYEFKGEKASANCKSWQRIPENGLCRTITTTLTAQCSRTGQWVHYSQPRLLTVQEARIAQGFPDGEVLVGDTARQFKIVGNSVARAVSLAMGLALRKAYLES